MSHKITRTEFEITFSRQDSGCMRALFIFGGLSIVILSFDLTTEDFGWIVKLSILFFGIAFGAAAYFIPKIQRLHTPEKIRFDFRVGLLELEMDDLANAIIPFNDIIDFEISSEKRSPSAANSTGINYIHYHVSARRKNGACWTITTTTKANEAKQLLAEIIEKFNHARIEPIDTEAHLTTKLKIKQGNPLDIYYKKNKISIYRDSIELINSGTSRRFRIKDFSEVIYSYSGAIKNSNAIISFIFSSGQEQKIERFNMLFRSLNPIELLVFENWLSKEINNRKSALGIKLLKLAITFSVISHSKN